MAPSTSWGQCQFELELEGPDEIVWLSWHPKGNVLAAGASDATVWMWNIPSGNLMNCFSGHSAALTCGRFTPDGRKLVTTSEDGSLIVWDPKSATALSRLQPSDARFKMGAGITSLALSPDSKVAVVGGAAGGLRVVNISNIDDGGAALVVASLAGHEEGESIESIAFIDLLGNPSGRGAPSAPRVSTSVNVVSIATDGKAIVWDLSASKVRCEAHLDEPMTDLVVHGAGPLFTTSSADGKVVTWDARTAQHVAIHAGFNDAVLNVVAGPDDGYTQGTETGGVGAAVDLSSGKGWKVVAAGDEGVALVFRC
jgi:ribosome assembly protein SQT1